MNKQLYQPFSFKENGPETFKVSARLEEITQC